MTKQSIAKGEEFGEFGEATGSWSRCSTFIFLVAVFFNNLVWIVCLGAEVEEIKAQGAFGYVRNFSKRKIQFVVGVFPHATDVDVSHGRGSRQVVLSYYGGN